MRRAQQGKDRRGERRPVGSASRRLAAKGRTTDRANGRHDSGTNADDPRCHLCGDPLDGFFVNYPNPICPACDGNAVNAEGRRPVTNSGGDGGDNPVFIGGVKCWRRYRFGGWVTMADPFGFLTLMKFYAHYFKDGELKAKFSQKTTKKGR